MTDKPKKEFKKVIVEGIAMYPFVHIPKKGFKKDEPPQFSLDLVVDEENAKKLLDEGLKVAKVQVDEDTKKPKVYEEYPGKKVFTLRRKTQRIDKNTGDVILLDPLTVVDSQLVPIPSTILIGNGSKVRCSVNPYTMTIEGKEVTGHMLLGVQVLGLVEFVSNKDSGLSKVDEGFTLAKSDEVEEGLDEANLFNPE